MKPLQRTLTILGLFLFSLNSWSALESRCDVSLGGVASLGVQKQTLIRFYNLEEILSRSKVNKDLLNAFEDLVALRSEIQQKINSSSSGLTQEIYMSLSILGDEGRENLQEISNEQEKMDILKVYFEKVKDIVQSDRLLAGMNRARVDLPLLLIENRDTILAIAKFFLQNAESDTELKVGEQNNSLAPNILVSEIDANTDLALYAQYIYKTQVLKLLLERSNNFR